MLELLIGIVALILAFLAGLAFRSQRERRMSEVIDLAFREVDRREKETEARVRKLEKQLQLSNE